VNRQQLLSKIDRAWATFTESYAGLSPFEMTDVSVTSAWSVKDVISHVTWWEEEALKYLPLVAEGARPPKYSAMYGGIDAFNALMTEERRALPLAEVLKHAQDVHSQLVAYVAGVPEALVATDTRFRQRLRLDTYGHYPLHAKVIREWRARSAGWSP
jgi:hypothetical protein